MALKVPTAAESKNKKDTAYILVFCLGKSINKKINNTNKLDKENLASSYPNNFLKELFERKEKEIVHRDKQNDILIKILRD